MRLEDILEAVTNIEAYVAEMDFERFRQDRKTVDAVIRNIEIIGEAARHVGPEAEQALPDVPWRDVRDMRNLLMHQYFGVDLSIVWETITRDLPALRARLQAYLDGAASESESTARPSGGE
jgi:uncharacterized protein with HEPN domain